jgi:aminoglycoside 2'-N-acetyltransferase I
MSSQPLRLAIVRSADLHGRERNEVADLCSAAFEEDYAPFLTSFGDCTHVLGLLGSELISHALWLPRRLRVGDTWISNAAYVEAVATKKGYEGRGHASTIMRRVQEEIRTFEIAALSPFAPEWYERLGWKRWRGALLILRGAVVIPTPEECVMVYSPAGRAFPDLDQSLTAEWRPLEVW